MSNGQYRHTTEPMDFVVMLFPNGRNLEGAAGGSRYIAEATSPGNYKLTRFNSEGEVLLADLAQRPSKGGLLYLYGFNRGAGLKYLAFQVKGQSGAYRVNTQNLHTGEKPAPRRKAAAAKPVRDPFVSGLFDDSTALERFTSEHGKRPRSMSELAASLTERARS